MENQRVIEAITARLMNASTEEDEQLISQWTELSGQNDAFLQRLTREKQALLGAAESLFDEADTQSAWKLMEQRMQHAENTENTGDRSRRAAFFPYLKYAAMIVVVLFTSFVIWNRTAKHNARTPDTSYETAANTGAELVLGDGSVVALEKNGNALIEATEGVTIEKKSGHLDYSQSESTAQAPVYNEMRTKNGVEYVMTLSDGTRVYLNAKSRFRYPVRFTGASREVELEGEAYFEVARNEQKPFRVTLRDGVSVEVLGTAFNVRAYADEKNVETVLEKGSVRVKQAENSLLMQPGKRVVCTDDAPMQMDAVDTELYTSWRNGHFIFHKESTERILHKISQWYGLDVVFLDDKAKNMIFSGDIRKYETIQNLLEAMHISSGICCERKGNTLYVKTCK